MHFVFSPCKFAYGASRCGGGGDGRNAQNHNVEELMKKLNLTEDEVAVMDFYDNDREKDMASVEYALVGKVLSLTPVHAQLVRSAMKPVWGNLVGLKIRPIGEKDDNMFVAEFGSHRDLERVLVGSPPPGIQWEADSSRVRL